jgi:hypothetical protein
MRKYVVKDDGLEPTDCDEYYDYPAPTVKDLAVQCYVKIVSEPEHDAYLDERLNEAIMELLRWAHDNRARLHAHGHPASS